MLLFFAKKLKLYYTRGITPKHVTSGGVHLRGLAPGQHSSEETSQHLRAVSGTKSDLTGMGIKPQNSCTGRDVFIRFIFLNFNKLAVIFLGPLDVAVASKCNPCLSSPCLYNSSCRVEPVEGYQCLCAKGKHFLKTERFNDIVFQHG